MSKRNWDIRNEGRTWSKDEAWQRFELLPEKFEMIHGRLLLSDEEIDNLLGLVLELPGLTGRCSWGVRRCGAQPSPL